jgi:hypothetical protein
MSFQKKVFILRERRNLDYMLQVIAANWEQMAKSGHPMAATLSESKRSLEANALMWVILTDWSNQVEWQVNGQTMKLSPEDWKTILTAAFMKEMGRIAPGLDGGMVLLGCRTREFTVRQMTDFIEFLYAASAQRGVVIDRQVVRVDQPEELGRVG